MPLPEPYTLIALEWTRLLVWLLFSHRVSCIRAQFSKCCNPLQLCTNYLQCNSKNNAKIGPVCKRSPALHLATMELLVPFGVAIGAPSSPNIHRFRKGFSKRKIPCEREKAPHVVEIFLIISHRRGSELLPPPPVPFHIPHSLGPVSVR